MKEGEQNPAARPPKINNSRRTGESFLIMSHPYLQQEEGYHLLQELYGEESQPDEKNKSSQK